MTAPDRTLPLTLDEIRAVTAYALACAELALPLFDREHPADLRPRAVLDAAHAFAAGGRRTRAIRTTAFDAHRAARDAATAGNPAAAEAARAAAHVGGAAYLHPLAATTQGGHILISAAHTARAFELDTGDAGGHLARAVDLAPPDVVAVLRRYPPAPPGRGRVGELWRALDALLRARGSLG